MQSLPYPDLETIAETIEKANEDLRRLIALLKERM